MVNSECFFSDDVNLHYHTEGDGPVLVCLHGGKGNSGDYFFPFLSPLVAELQMVYLDKRGSGKSKPIPDKNSVSLDGFTRDIGNLIEHLGARLALLLAVQHPKQVRELYLVAGGPAYPEIEQDWLFQFREEAMKQDGTYQVRGRIQDLYNSGQISKHESFRRQIIEGAEMLYRDAPESKRRAILDAMRRLVALSLYQ